MQNMSDEVLMAYADDALSKDERRQVEAAIALNPALSARLEPFVVTRSALPEIFSEALTSPLPDRLVKTIMKAPIGQRKAAFAADAGTILARVRAFLSLENPSFGSAVALAALVVAVAGAGVMATRSLAPSGGGTVVADGVLATALETAPLAKPIKADQLQAVATNTFFDLEGRVCRQYDLTDAAKGKVGGFACRTGEGQWQIVFHAPAADVAPSPGDANVPAGDDTAAAQALETAIDQAIKGDVLSLEEDARLLANGWRATTTN